MVATGLHKGRVASDQGVDTGQDKWKPYTKAGNYYEAYKDIGITKCPDVLSQSREHLQLEGTKQMLRSIIVSVVSFMH